MTNSITIENMMAVENSVVGNNTLLLCKETPHKWHIANAKGGVLFTSKTKKGAVLEITRLRKAAATAAKKSASVKSSKKPTSKGGKSAEATGMPAAINAKASKPEPSKPAVKTNKNVNKFRFGSKIDTDTVVEYAGEVWGDTFELSNVEFVDSHYWKGTVTNKEGVSVDKVRLDYFINFCRVPTALKTPEVQAIQQKAIAAAK